MSTPLTVQMRHITNSLHSVDGVAKVCAVGKVRGFGTVNIYVTGSDAAVSTDVVAKVQEIVAKQRAECGCSCCQCSAYCL